MNLGAMRVLARLAKVFSAASVLLALNCPANAIEWSEVGDAGDRPSTAQQVAVSGPLTRIEGILANNGLDVDLYEIRIPDAASAGRFSVQSTFQSTTTSTPRGSLYLFDGEGKLVAGADGLSATSLPGLAALAPDEPGTYFVAVAPVGTGPFGPLRGSVRYPLFNQAGVIGNFGPSGPGASDVLDAWGGNYYPGNITYTLLVNGVAPIPEPSAMWLLGIGLSALLAVLGHRAQPRGQMTASRRHFGKAYTKLKT